VEKAARKPPGETGFTSSLISSMLLKDPMAAPAGPVARDAGPAPMDLSTAKL